MRTSLLYRTCVVGMPLVGKTVQIRAISWQETNGRPQGAILFKEGERVPHGRPQGATLLYSAACYARRLE